jgi:hypothetical protein
MNSFNVIAHTDPITDEAADWLALRLTRWSPVIDSDGTVVLTIVTEEGQNWALYFALPLLIGPGTLVIQSVEVMTTAVYDEVYLEGVPA